MSHTQVHPFVYSAGIVSATQRWVTFSSYPVHPFKCPVCERPFLWPVTVCGACLDAILPAPSVCPKCFRIGNPCSSALCDLLQGPKFSAVVSGFLAVGLGYQVLKAWKKNPSAAFESELTKRIHWQDVRTSIGTADWVVPVPQSPRRILRLGGGGSWSVAMLLSAKLGIRLEPLLKYADPGDSLFRTRRRQAELDAWERTQTHLRWSVGKTRGNTSSAKHIVLVDDFVTTGHTVRSALEVLQRSGRFERISLFCLGLRTRSAMSTRTPGLRPAQSIRTPDHSIF